MVITKQNSYYKQYIAYFARMYGEAKATEIVDAICDRVTAWKCREKFKRENEMRLFEVAHLQMPQWHTEAEIERQVSAEVNKEADEYFISLLESYKNPQTVSF